MKKHSPEEVLEKLHLANDLARRGLSQSEICNELGVSIMTLHRWKKLPTTLVPSRASVSDLQHLQKLQLENQQLRKIITDLMLEKLRIEEVAAKSQLTELKSN
jgi:putative transposase